MPDVDDYADAPSPVTTTTPAPIRVAERVQVTGWLGLFFAFVLAAGTAIAPGTNVGPDGWWVGTFLGVTALVLAAAGGYLVIVGFLDRPPRGELLVMANLVVVGPLLGLGVGFLLLPFGMMVYVLFLAGPATPAMVPPSIMAVLTTLPNLVLLVKFRRQVRAFVRAWLDPTAP